MDIGHTRLRQNKGNNKITEQSYKGKVKTHNYINRQNQSTTETNKQKTSKYVFGDTIRKQTQTHITEARHGPSI
jgi:hypothetical protein